MNLKMHENMAVVLLKGLGRLSLPCIYRLACCFCLILRPFPMQLKRTIARNIEKCFPALSLAEKKALENTALLHTIWRLLEMPFFWFNTKKVQDVPLQISGEEAFEQDFAKGQGVIVITAHFGAWEAVNAYMGPRYSCVTLYKPLKKAYQETLVTIARERYGVEFFETSIGGVKKIFESLKQGKCLGIMSDHDPGDSGGIFVPFFGIPANTTTLTAKLVQKSAAAVYTLSAERLAKGQGFHLRFKKIDNLRGIDIEESTERVNQAIENIIMDAPAQYEWSYKRFRRTPTGTDIPFYE